MEANGISPISYKKHADEGCFSPAEEVGRRDVGRSSDKGDTDEETSTGMQGLAYGVSDVPPWYLCLLLGFQVGLKSSSLFLGLLNLHKP